MELRLSKLDVNVGEDVEVGPPDGVGHGLSGTSSSLEQLVGDEWQRVFVLFSWPGGEPSYIAAGSDYATTALGIGGPVIVRIPPVPPGRYRVVRSYMVSEDGTMRWVEATAEVTVR